MHGGVISKGSVDQDVRRLADLCLEDKPVAGRSITPQVRRCEYLADAGAALDELELLAVVGDRFHAVIELHDVRHNWCIRHLLHDADLGDALRAILGIAQAELEEAPLDGVAQATDVVDDQTGVRVDEVLDVLDASRVQQELDADQHIGHRIAD